ncbi:MAG: hypothetical protein IJP11_06535 [Oscillospiraceae bacterium]|nr:hypothetical protein [Oscillospiraceae bacterium]
MSKSKKVRKRLLLCLIPLCFALFLSGCLLKPVDELYTLPRQSDAYYNLQLEIEKVVTGSVQYCAPTAGENRQPLQMQDLDGDGVDEAIVFAKDTGDKPLKIYIFSRSGDSFRLASTVEGVGASFDSVCYEQIDGSPGKEIIVGRAISDQLLKSVSVHSFQGNSTLELMSANYSALETFDLDQDGRQDLFLIRFEADTQRGSAELYRFSEGVMVRDPEQQLSDGITSVRRVITGYTAKDVPAVFVAGTLDEHLIRTDVFAIRDSQLQNIVTGENAESMTVRNYYVYSDDIDGDGLVELPEPFDILHSEDAENASNYRLIQWYNLGLDGKKTYKMLTYHDYARGFYVELDSTWKENISVTRDDTAEEGFAYRFSQWIESEKTHREVFTIYVLSGDHRTELAVADGRFLLAEKNDISFAASIGDSPWAKGMTEDDLLERFRFISIDWNSGEM